MEIKTATSFAGFLVALATLHSPSATAVNLPSEDSGPASPIAELSPEATPPSLLENRLARLTAALREREAQLSDVPPPPEDRTIAGWGNGRGGAWVNSRRGGWGDRSGGGGFANFNPWRNGWGDRGGFFNHNPWRNGSGWVNLRRVY